MGQWFKISANDSQPLYENYIAVSLTHHSLDKMAAISQTTFSKAFLSMKKYQFRLFVPKGPINNIPALVQIMAWQWPGNKPLSEPMLTQLTDAYMRHLGDTS